MKKLDFLKKILKNVIIIIIIIYLFIFLILKASNFSREEILIISKKNFRLAEPFFLF